MSIGERILSEIIKQRMFVIAEPDPEVGHVFVWSSGSAEQLEALVNEAYLERVGAIGPFENPDSQKPLEPAETWLQERANWMIAIKLLEAERDQLRARAAELEADKARLDWLIKDACIVEPTPKADAKLHIFTGPMHSRQYERAAIDAARAGKGAT